jgi:hypothetical protein
MKQNSGMNGNMDILKKFRYNFHYWLRNCYQAEEPEIPKVANDAKDDSYGTSNMSKTVHQKTY